MPPLLPGWLGSQPLAGVLWWLLRSHTQPRTEVPK